jgi:integrase
MSYGDGSIWQGKTKAGKSVWFVEIVIGTKPNGKPRVTRRQAGTKQAAIKLRQQLNAQKNVGQLNQRANITIADYGRHWAREVKPNTVKPHTATNYEWLFNRYVCPFLGKCRMADLNFPLVQQWINNLLEAGYGVSTVNSARQVLGQIAKQAWREGILGSNPVALTDKVRKQLGDPTQVKPAWDMDEAKRALEAAKGAEMDLFVHMCVYLGLRHGEALGLTYDAIDFDARTIDIKFTLKDERRITSTGEGVVRLRLQEPKTKSSIRKLALTDTLFESFERHKMMQSVRQMKAGPDWRESGMVFTTSIGTGVSQANNLKRYKKWIAANNLRYIRVHDLRHTFGTLALENGVPVEQVSQVMGHADIGITKKIYAPDVRGFNEKAILAMETALNPDVTVPASWLTSTEEITPQELEVTNPVKLSQRPRRPIITPHRRP